MLNLKPKLKDKYNWNYQECIFFFFFLGGGGGDSSMCKRIPAGIWCQNDVVLTSMRRDYVASTLIRRHFDTKCPLVCESLKPFKHLQIPHKRFINPFLVRDSQAFTYQSVIFPTNDWLTTYVENSLGLLLTLYSYAYATFSSV